MEGANCAILHFAVSNVVVPQGVQIFVAFLDDERGQFGMGERFGPRFLVAAEEILFCRVVHALAVSFWLNPVANFTNWMPADLQ